MKPPKDERYVENQTKTAAIVERKAQIRQGK
jgi:hypothetical protein